MVLDLFPLDFTEWEKLGPFDYVSSCCLAYIDYMSGKELINATDHNYGFTPPHWIYCSDCLKPLQQFTDLEPMQGVRPSDKLRLCCHGEINSSWLPSKNQSNAL